MVSIYLYVPNLIGYTRIILMFTAYHYAESMPYVFFICYFLSQFFDMFDGMAARAFNQSTKFGALLDMVTDRCSTVGLLFVVAQRYPHFTLACHFFVWLDIFSHWGHMLATLKSGSESHKQVKSGPWLLRFYYKARWFMVLLIFGAEGWPLSLYLLSFGEQIPNYISIPVRYIGYFFCPLFFTKHFINIIQFFHAVDLLERTGKKD